ncbi:hypothetical protein [Maritimibacter sp. HL-12]|jgi:uncharacterized membrane protein|uniref:hypothetical protein n=1 Tax=Maritimibacter sp. HL-12 TaxID=1162418 RepID=UPI000A0EEFC7|nr:hypothetical protein [Maritimibacter sp. HL-12]SMH36813.1 Uncharacterised protein family (UPF0093) [Maritimibacter sp. HL-12]
MIEILKIVHYLSLAVGIGGGLANAIIGARAAISDPPVKPVLGSISGVIAKTAGVSIILLWLTGIALVYLIFDGWAILPWAFWVKLAFVVVLSLLSLRMNLYILQAARTKSPPPAATMKLLGRLAILTSILIVIFAVIAFTT